MGLPNSGIIHETADGIADELPLSGPDYRVLIHGHGGVAGKSDQQPADGLHVAAKGPNVANAVKGSYCILFHPECVARESTDNGLVDSLTPHLQRIGMDEKGVASGTL